VIVTTATITITTATATTTITTAMNNRTKVLQAGTESN
jgi:hypothetical protein